MCAKGVYHARSEKSLIRGRWEWGTEKYFEQPVVFALYGYFQYYSPEAPAETEVLGIYLCNDSYNIPTGTSLCIGVSQLHEEMNDNPEGI